MSLLDIPSRRSPHDAPAPLPVPPPDAPPEDLRRLFRRHASGVAVVTATHAGRPVGLLVSSLASVSSAPPLLSFNVARTASAWPALAGADRLAVHLLRDDQDDVAQRFARSGADRFAAPTAWHHGPDGVPVLSGVAGWALAAVERRIEIADHVIVLARVLSTDTADGASPLLHHDGAFHRPVPATHTRSTS